MTRIPVVRPIPIASHPLSTGDYRIATPAIQAAYRLIERMLTDRISGALIYGAPRLGKTRAIEYLRLLLAHEHPRVATFHAQCEHKPRHAEGPFLTNLLEAVGDPDPDRGANATKRKRLLLKFREAAIRSGGARIVLFCDEAQRYDLNEYEWLRDVHDALDRQRIRLFTVLVGQDELLAQRTALQRAGMAQIIARLMVEVLRFHGIRSVEDVAKCLMGFDTTTYPEDSSWSFTRFFLPQATDSGFKLAEQASLLWHAFESAHREARLTGPLEIPMEYFTRAVEVFCREAYTLDAPGFVPDERLWRIAIRGSGYVQARQAVSRELAA